MQSKLDATRESLKSMMTRSCWRKEWRDAAIKWSEQIVIAPILKRHRETKDQHCVIFPTTGGIKDDRGYFFAYDPETLAPSPHNGSIYDVLNWRNLSPDECGLLTVPINLAMDIFTTLLLHSTLNFLRRTTTTLSVTTRCSTSMTKTNATTT